MMRKLVCEKRTYSRETAVHEHDYGQMLFPLQGSLHLQLTDRSIQLQGEHVLYLPPSSLHQFYSLNRNEFLVVDIPKNYLRLESRELYTSLNEKWKAIRYLLLEESKQVEPDDLALKHLVHYISDQLTETKYPSIRYLQNHFHKPIKVEQLAQIEHYHPAYYSKWFKQITGKTPLEYQQMLRIEEAKRLLAETNWSLTMISQEVGFEHLSSFSRLFMKWEKKSPKEYRNQLK